MDHGHWEPGDTPNMPAKEWKKWLISQCIKWSDDPVKKELWQNTCVSRFERVPHPRDMSIVEMEETLVLAGDEEVPGVKSTVETMYDGKVNDFMRDWNNPDEASLAAFIISPSFESKIYCHKTHIMGLEVGDVVRIAVHMNQRNQPQASFCDRLNNRASNPRMMHQKGGSKNGPGGKMGAGKMKGEGKMDGKMGGKMDGKMGGKMVDDR